MKRAGLLGATFVLVSLCLGSPTISAEEMRFGGDSSSRSSLGALQSRAEISAQELTFQQALDKSAKELTLTWVRFPDGRRRRMWCDFQCSNACYWTRWDCIQSGYPQAECDAEWSACVCQCCTSGCS